MKLPGVVAVGIGEHGDYPSTRVMVRKVTQTVKMRIPDQIDDCG